MSDDSPALPPARKIHEYDGDEITVRYEPKICIHAAECVKGLPAVFNPQLRRWIAPEKAAVEEIVEVIGRCPSGALSYSLPQKGDAAASDTAASDVGAAQVTTVTDGPLMVSGRLEIRLADGAVEQREKAALCRCGASENKPFCDGRHREIGFSAK
jgi:uncharacterized Fe-S cluster protein YjdI